MLQFFKQWSLVAAGLFLLGSLPAKEKKPADQPQLVEELKKSGTPPRPLSMPPPKYPFELSRRGITGSVLVEFIINTHGDVPEARVIQSTNRGFEIAALTAVQKWKFKPGELNGRPVSTRVSQRLFFNLEEKR